MAKRVPKKQPTDKQLASLSHAAVDATTSTTPRNNKTAADKNPAAVPLGRLGGKKGGPARARKLTKKQRSDIAKKAAAARWKKRT